MFYEAVIVFALWADIHRGSIWSGLMADTPRIGLEAPNSSVVEALPDN